MDTALFALAVFGTVIALCAASRCDFVKMYRYFERKRDNRRGWEWRYLIEHHFHSHADDMLYAVDTRMYPHLRPDPHHEFYNRPVKVSTSVFKEFEEEKAARRTLEKPVITYEELTGIEASVNDDGCLTFGNLRALGIENS